MTHTHEVFSDSNLFVYEYWFTYVKDWYKQTISKIILNDINYSVFYALMKKCLSDWSNLKKKHLLDIAEILWT